MERVYLGLGSNMGDRASFLKSAVRRLGALLSGIRLSNVYETSPLYVKDQGMFLNAVVEGYTDLRPLDLLDAVQAIENQAGRDRTSVVRRGPRVLDIDVLLYGDLIIRTDRLTCPHPLMKERLFVLIPLLELNPDCTEPGSGIHYSIYSKALSAGTEQGIRPAEGQFL